MSSPTPALSDLVTPLIASPVPAFCTVSLHRKWKIPSSLAFPSWLPGFRQGSP